MAAYREHITVSGLCGFGYGVAGFFLGGFTPVQGAIAGVLTWVSGMLPDVDSESGKPVREIFSLLAAAIPCMMLRRLMRWSGNPETTILMAFGIYALVRYGASFALKKLSVHRGMFHSIPAMVISAELAFLGYHSENFGARLYVAGGVALGFLSHLVLDEIYSVQWSGVRVKLAKSAGSAMKFYGDELLPNVVTYSMAFLLSYMTLIEAGVVEDPTQTPTRDRSIPRRIAEEIPETPRINPEPARRAVDKVAKPDFDETPFFR